MGAKIPRAHESYNGVLGRLSLRQKTGGRPGGSQRAVTAQCMSVLTSVQVLEVSVKHPSANGKNSLSKQLKNYYDVLNVQKE